MINSTMLQPIFLILVTITCTRVMQAQSTSSSIVATQSQTPGVYNVVEEMPEFPGGTGEMMSYRSKSIRYPSISRDPGYEGTSYIRFIVDTAGYIKEATVLKGVPNCPDCDREALRLVKAMPRWKPGKQNGKAVNVYYTLPSDSGYSNRLLL